MTLMTHAAGCVDDQGKIECSCPIEHPDLAWRDAEAELDLGRDEELPDDWAIEDTAHANRTLGRIRDIRAEFNRRNAHVAAIKAELESRLADVTEFLDDEQASMDARLSHYEVRLIEWLRRAHEADPAVKSVKLLNGRVTSRAGQDKAVIEDPDALLVAAQQAGADWCRAVPRPDLNAIKRHVKATGEIPDGIAWVAATEADRTYTVEVAK